MDLCLRSENYLIWLISDFVIAAPNDLPKVSYDYDGQGHIIRYKDKRGEVHIVIDMVRYIIETSW